MNKIVRVSMIMAFAVALVAPLAAAEKTLTGTLMCAMCHMHKADATECQDVLVVTDSSGAKTEYYVTKNDVAQKSGEACTLEIPATVTGEVSEKDGKTWITASKIEKKS